MTILLIILLILVLYFYWYSQAKPACKPSAKPPKTDSEVFWDAPEFELSSDSEEEPNIPLDKQEWFTANHWLSEREIDWALQQIYQDLYS